jgi:hypothetical protein
MKFSRELAYEDAIALVMRQKVVSTTLLMRFTDLDRDRCDFLLACMEIEGVVGRADFRDNRRVLLRIG